MLWFSRSLGSLVFCFLAFFLACSSIAYGFKLSDYSYSLGDSERSDEHNEQGYYWYGSITCEFDNYLESGYSVINGKEYNGTRTPSAIPGVVDLTPGSFVYYVFCNHPDFNPDSQKILSVNYNCTVNLYVQSNVVLGSLFLTHYSLGFSGKWGSRETSGGASFENIYNGNIPLQFKGEYNSEYELVCVNASYEGLPALFMQLNCTRAPDYPVVNVPSVRIGPHNTHTRFSSCYLRSTGYDTGDIRGYFVCMTKSFSAGETDPGVHPDYTNPTSPEAPSATKSGDLIFNVNVSGVENRLDTTNEELYSIRGGLDKWSQTQVGQLEDIKSSLNDNLDANKTTAGILYSIENDVKTIDGHFGESVLWRQDLNNKLNSHFEAMGIVTGASNELLEQIRSGNVDFRNDMGNGFTALGRYLSDSNGYEVLIVNNTKDMAEHTKVMAGDISSLSSSVNSSLSSLVSDSSSIKNDVSSIKNDVSSMKNDVSSIKNDVSSMSSDVSKKLDTVNEHLQYRGLQLESYASSVGTQLSDIAGSSAGIHDDTWEIKEELKRGNSSINSNMEDLKSRVSALVSLYREGKISIESMDNALQALSFVKASVSEINKDNKELILQVGDYFYKYDGSLEAIKDNSEVSKEELGEIKDNSEESKEKLGDINTNISNQTTEITNSLSNVTNAINNLGDSISVNVEGTDISWFKSGEGNSFTDEFRPSEVITDDSVSSSVSRLKNGVGSSAVENAGDFFEGLGSSSSSRIVLFTLPSTMGGGQIYFPSWSDIGIISDGKGYAQYLSKLNTLLKAGLVLAISLAVFKLILSTITTG